MPDITMCMGVSEDKQIKCQKRQGCYRYIATPNKYQSYLGDIPLRGAECEYYWQVKSKASNNENDV